MDPQQSPHVSSQHQKVQLVAQQLLKAINEPGSQTDSNIIIFLTKLYKNNSPIKNKKMKSIRLSRFIQLLECLVHDFPQQKDDVEIIYHCIVSTLLNDKNFCDQEDYELVHSMGVEIARVLEKLCEGEYGFWAVKILAYLINNEPLTPLMEFNQFEQKLKQSTYYPAINLDNRPSQAQSEHQVFILDQPPISNVILDSLSIQKVYTKLFKSSQNKSSIINLFYQHLQKLSEPPSIPRKQLFLDCFISKNEKLSISEAQAVLKILENKGFDRQTINEVVNKITQEKLSLEELFQIDFKKIKGIEEVFVQCLLQQTSKKSISQVIQLFLNMKSDNNYFPLYLILKLNKKIPSEYIGLFFVDSQVFNVRRAIVFVLAIIDNEQESFNLLLKAFTSWNKIQKVRTKKNYQCILKAIHFSLQNITKASTISQILRFIYKQNLNKESCLEFLNYNTLKVSTHEETKHLMTQENRNGLLILFKTLSEFDKMTKGKAGSNSSTEEMKELEIEHKCRLDLEFLVNSNPYIQQEIMSSIKELNKLLDGSVTVDELVKQLPTLKDSLWEVSLMWINNKYETFYTEEANNQAVEWALKTYKKLSNQLNTQLKTLLQREKLDKYFKLIKTLIEYGIEKQSELKINTENTKVFTPKIKQLINSSNSKSERLNSNSFNDYFLTQSLWKSYITSDEKSIDKTYKKILWVKVLLIELKELIKNMTKSQKTAAKKELKNIVADNVADVLAFKAIHEYFDSEIEDQGKDILLEIFRHIQPDMEFFQRTEALASSLSIEFYSIFEELPSLLENFNSDTLIFLSKLITCQKPAQDEKKKKINNKKKNEKDVNATEDNICINSIVKNFNLLFSDPNSTDSHKSLFIILRRLFELGKVDKNQLCVNMNTWLSEINFIPCSGFQPWKNKVLTLSKMWKNAAEIFGLLSDKKDEKKFEIKVLQKHFNLFTDLLNKLYENFRDQPEFLELEQRILLTLCLIYKKQDFSDQIEPETDMTAFIIKKFQQRNISRVVLDNKFYYCHECKKSACYACSSFLHRNHDKTYTGKTGNCEHENVKGKKEAFLKIDNPNLIFGSGITAMLKKNEDLPEQLLERISQKLLLSEQLNASEEGDFLGRYSPNIQEILQGRIPKSKMERSQEIKRKLRENQNQLRSEMNREERKENTVEDEKTISPEAEDYFQYKQPYCKEFKKIHSELNPVIPKIHIPQAKINVSPLAKVFLRELQNEHFHYEEQAIGNEQVPKPQSASVQEIKDKYLFFRNNNLKGENRDYPYGRGRGGYGGFTYGSNPRNELFARRSIIACNKKNLFIPSSLSMMNLSMTKLREKLDKKIQNKEYSVQEQEKNYVATPPLNLPFEVVQTSLSQSSTYPTLAVISVNQLCFYVINADGRFGRQINTQFHRVDNIMKFTWINEKKNLFAIAYNNYIRVGGVSPSNNIKTFAKAQIGRSIRDFDGYMNSKLYMLFIVDTEGRLYFVQVDFKDSKNAAYSSADRLVNLVDENGKQLPNDIYSVKNIDGNRALLSSQNGTLRIVEINRESNNWKAKTFDLRKAMNCDQPIVLEAIKLVKEDDEAIFFSAISRRFKAFENRAQRKCQGSLVLIKLHENIASSSVLFTREENIESYDFTFASLNTLNFIYANEEGAISMFKHSIELEPTQIQERITPNTDNNSIRAFCRKMVSSNVFYQVEDGAMPKNLEFKQNKPLNGNFNINLKEKEQISIKELYPNCSHFVTGIMFEVELPPSVSDYTGQQNSSKELDCVAVIKLKCLDSTYKFYCNSKKRQIQIPLNLKQTIELFCHQNQLKITYSVEINEDILQKEKFTPKELQELIKIKTVHLYGFEARDLSTSANQQSFSVYHKAFKELYEDWFTYQEYQKEGFEEYLLNIYRMDFHNIDMKRLYKLKYDNSNQGNGFKMNEINLFLKLELFSQTISQSLSNDKTTTKEEIEEYLNSIKKELLSKEYKRKSLENSVYRLCQAVCHTYATKTSVTVGHPYHKETLINMHNFVTMYKKWLQKKNIFTFDQLCTLLSNLILSQSIDLQLILQTCPQLIIELSTSFKKLITERKHKQYSDEDSEISVTRICSKYIAILCEYYQVLKNRNVEKTEEKLLFLLEQVFAHAKSDMPKELIMNPFLYLESILNLNEFTEINSSIELYNTQSQNDFTDAFFDLDRAQKLNKKLPKKELSSNSLKEEEQQLLNENSNSNFEAIIEEEKEMEEEEKEMYMQIEEEDFDDEKDEINLDDLEPIDLQIPKEKSSLKEINKSNQQNQQLSSSQKNLDDILTKTLLAQTLPSLKKLTINHYDFPLQLAIALFRKENFLTPSNIYFYLGLLYNLLKIIENNLKIRQNKAKIMEFVEIVDKRMENVEYSSLFIVLNFFLGPRYSKGPNGTIIKKPESSLSEYFSNFYAKNLIRFGYLLTAYNPTVFSPVAKLSDIMRFTSFEIKNELYNLKLISNIYLSFRIFGNNFTKTEEKNQIKEELLFKLVKYKMPVLKNIMLYEKWENELDRAKILVSYEILRDERKKLEDKEEGIIMLYNCAKQTPQKFIQELLLDETKVSFLEEFSLLSEEISENIQKKVFQLLEIYYNS